MKSAFLLLAALAGVIAADQAPLCAPPDAGCAAAGCSPPQVTVVEGTTTIVQDVSGSPPWPAPEGFGSVSLVGSTVQDGTAKG